MSVVSYFSFLSPLFFNVKLVGELCSFPPSTLKSEVSPLRLLAVLWVSHHGGLSLAQCS